jgi:hypothetical protein
MAAGKNSSQKPVKAVAQGLKIDKVQSNKPLGPATRSKNLLANGTKFQDVRDTLFSPKGGNKAKNIIKNRGNR